MPTKIITAQHFEERMGEAPIQDDLERANCKHAGEIGHQSCGWCEQHDRPRFSCRECFEAQYGKREA